MKLAVISDIHGNMDAFNAVLRDIDGLSVDDIISLGDAIGYGPEPEKVLEMIIRRNITHIMGNHEDAVRNSVYTMGMKEGAVNSTLWTRKRLLEASKNGDIDFQTYLDSLRNAHVRDGVRFVHGCPPYNNNGYIDDYAWDPRLYDGFREQLSCVGHVHRLLLFSRGANGVVEDFDLKNAKVTLGRDAKHILAVGSVGQPRNADVRAQYVLLDTGKIQVITRTVEYDILSTIRKIKKTNLPQSNAERLICGY